jgi:hypothetical protein
LKGAGWADGEGKNPELDAKFLPQPLHHERCHFLCFQLREEIRLCQDDGNPGSVVAKRPDQLEVLL